MHRGPSLAVGRGTAEEAATQETLQRCHRPIAKSLGEHHRDSRAKSEGRTSGLACRLWVSIKAQQWLLSVCRFLYLTSLLLRLSVLYNLTHSLISVFFQSSAYSLGREWTSGMINCVILGTMINEVFPRASLGEFQDWYESYQRYRTSLDTRCLTLSKRNCISWETHELSCLQFMLWIISQDIFTTNIKLT